MKVRSIFKTEDKRRRIIAIFCSFFNVIIAVLKSKFFLHPKLLTVSLSKSHAILGNAGYMVMSNLTAVNAFLRTIASFCHLEIPQYQYMILPLLRLFHHHFFFIFIFFFILFIFFFFYVRLLCSS